MVFLDKNNMTGAKPVSTPLSTNEVLSLNDGVPLADAALYHQTLGSMQYLSLTCLDISYAVNKASQFMHQPYSKHWPAVKQLLRYLNGTSTLGLLIKKNLPHQFYSFADEDWAGDKDDRTSTTAYVVFLGENPISWSSQIIH